MSTPTREKIAALKIKLADTRAAPLPEADAEGILDAKLDHMESDYFRTIRHVGAMLAHAQVSNDFSLSSAIGTGFAAEKFLVSALVRLCREQIRSDILEAMGQHQTPKRLAPESRQQDLNVIRRDLYELELADEADVEAGRVVRRADADPRAVLGLPYSVATQSSVLKFIDGIRQDL